MGLCLTYSSQPNDIDQDSNKSNLAEHIDSTNHNHSGQDSHETPIEPAIDDASCDEQRAKNSDDGTERTETIEGTCDPIPLPVSSIKLEQSGDSKEDNLTDPADASSDTIEPAVDPNETDRTNTNITTEEIETDTKEATTSRYHFIIHQAEKKKSNAPYSTFVDYSKLFTKPKATHAIQERLADNILNSTSKGHGRADLIEMEQKETGIILDPQRVAYNAWCTVQTSPTFIDQSKPKRIVLDTTQNKAAVAPITTLPALLDCGDNEQRLLLMGFIREMVSRFDFAWILPMDVIDLCFKYIPNKISSIFVIAGNMSNNYMEYHLFTAQSNDHHDVDTHTLYKHKRLEFKINDRNGKEIKTLDEDFDCAHCGVCYAENIKIPRTMHTHNGELNEFAAYSAIIKCGGEVIVDDMNFCTNYCNAIMFDTNALLLPAMSRIERETEIETATSAETEKQKQSKVQSLMEINCFELKLPRLKAKCQYTSIYSECQGLIAMGMDRKRNQSNVYQLSFKRKVDNRYDWKPLSRLQYNHLYGSMCMVNNDENLVVLGGNDSNKMEIYDWNTQEWNALRNVHYNTNYSGVCYNFLHSNILICGGYGASCRKSGCYDIVKDEWFKLPGLQYKHRCYPTVFTHVDNPSITYCFGDNNQSFSFMEYVDLRDDKQMIWCDINEKDNMYHYISPSQIRNIIV